MSDIDSTINGPQKEISPKKESTTEESATPNTNTKVLRTEAKIQIMSWNLKQLSINQSSIAWKDRRQHICDTILGTDFAPDIVIIQELLFSKADDTIKDITKWLNTEALSEVRVGKNKEFREKLELPEPTTRRQDYDKVNDCNREGFVLTDPKYHPLLPLYTYKISKCINPLGNGSKEVYGVIYRPAVVEVLDDDQAGHQTDLPVLTENLSESMLVKIDEDEDMQPRLVSFDKCFKPFNLNSSLNFDRFPIAMKFRLKINNRTSTVQFGGLDFTIVACHLATGGFQNVYETAALQNYCVGLNQSSTTILLGDFNIDEAGNRECWDKRIDLDYDEGSYNNVM